MLTRSPALSRRDQLVSRHPAGSNAGRLLLGHHHHHHQQHQLLSSGISTRSVQASAQNINSSSSSSSSGQPDTNYSSPSSSRSTYSILLAEAGSSNKRSGKQQKGGQASAASASQQTSNLPERSPAEKETLAAQQEAAAQEAATAALTAPQAVGPDGQLISSNPADSNLGPTAVVVSADPAALAAVQAAATPSGLLGIDSVSVTNQSPQGHPQGQQQLEVSVSHNAALSPEEAAAVAAGAAAAAGTQAALDEGLTEVSEVVEVVLPPRPQGLALVRTVGVDTHRYLTTNKTGQGVAAALGVLLLGTFAMAVYRAWQKANTTKAQRLRQVDRNKTLVEGLNKYLPGNRAGLTPGVARSLRGGFTPVEAFRKYLWFLLRERKFDQAAVDDMVHLKSALGLSDADTAEALRERAQRIYDKYGTLMINTEGMTMEGVQRKSTCRNLLRKLLYLIECGRLLPQPIGGAAIAAEDESTAVRVSGLEATAGAAEGAALAAAAVVDLRKIFGATEADLKELRITNLYEDEVDLESALGQTSATDGSVDGEEDGKTGKDKA